MINDISQIICILIDRGCTMANQQTETIEQKCMEHLFSKAQNAHCKSLYNLITFNETPSIICDPTTNIYDLSRRYQTIKYSHETQMYENYGRNASSRAKYRKCYDAINFCANNLIQQSQKYPEAMLRIVVITDGTVDQSDEITVSKTANFLTSSKIHLDIAIVNGWVSPTLCMMSKWTGANVFQINNLNDCVNVFGNPAFYDPRIRQYEQREALKITAEMVKESDIKRNIIVSKTVASSYNDQISTLKDESKLNDAMKKVYELRDNMLKIVNEINKQINEAPNAIIIFLVGNTGNGKSTFMYCMHGQRMVRIRLDNRWVLNIENMDINDKNQPLGHNGKSKTRTVNFMYVPELNIIFVDCPGYFDSLGADQNIINSLAINQVFNGRRQLKMKVLAFVSHDDFVERSGAVKDALNMVYGLIPNEEVLKRCLGVVITKGRKRDNEFHLEQIREISESKSAEINKTWKITDFIKHLCDNNLVWNFPVPEKGFEPGQFNNFPDANKIKNFMLTNPIIDPPHSIPLDTHTYDMILDLIHITGNCRSIINDLFDNISQEFLLNKLNIWGLKCWRCQINKIQKMRYKSLNEFASQIQTILPFPEKYSDLYKSMEFLSILQSFTCNVDDKKVQKKDILNSLNSLQNDFFNENDITVRLNDSLATLNGYINDAEKEEQIWKMKREECERKEEEYNKNILDLLERCQRYEEGTSSVQVSIEEENKKLEQQKLSVVQFRQQVKNDYKKRKQEMASEISRLHYNYMKDVHNSIDTLQRQIDAERYRNKYLRSSLH